MDDAGKNLKELLARYSGKSMKGNEGSKFKATLGDFLDNGPGTREDRLGVLIEQFVKLESEYTDFLKKRS
jgi:hypothetical protein